MLPAIDIVIVNWNAGGQLRECLELIAATNRADVELHRVVVVDNGSVDGSAEGLSTIDLPLHIVRNEHNRGFAAACNQGAKDSNGHYLLFLNPDIRLLPDALAKPVAFMERPQNRQVGIVGIQLLGSGGRVTKTCARFPTPGRFLSRMLGLDQALPRVFPSHFMTEWDHQATREVDQVMGAFFLIRRAVFEALRGFDERFFVYFEEVDLSLRARILGWRTFYLSDAQAHHRGGGTSERVRGVRLFYSLRSRILYAYKHFWWWSATVVTVATLVLEPVARLSLAAARGSARELGATLQGYALLLRGIFGILETAWRRGKT